MLQRPAANGKRDRAFEGASASRIPGVRRQGL